MARDVVAILIMRRDPGAGWRPVVVRRSRVVGRRGRYDDGRRIHAGAITIAIAIAIAIVVPPSIPLPRPSDQANHCQAHNRAAGGETLREGFACGRGGHVSLSTRYVVRRGDCLLP